MAKSDNAELVFVPLGRRRRDRHELRMLYGYGPVNSREWI
jgi:hypothetical protein